MQIDWSKAPEWARYVAMDDDGTWWWYAEKPIYNKPEWYALCQFEKVPNTTPRFQERPQ